MLLVNEVFGPTIQLLGEGPHTGSNCVFLRLANCNQTCNYCDTSYTWAFTKTKAAQHRSGLLYSKHAEIHPMEDMEVLQKLQGLGLVSSRVIISGGEPLLQDEGLVDLVKELRNNFQIDIETAGTILPVHLELLPDTYVVSPKLANSGNAPRVRYRPQVIEWFASSAAWPKTYFKFVVSRLDDFGEIDAMVKTHGIIRSHVYIMPEGTTPRAVTEGARLVADATIDRGYNLSLRSHVYIWGDKRAH